MDIKKRLGWKRGLPQKHEFQYFPHRGLVGLPVSVDLQPLCPQIYDQGDLGSCTANAGAVLAQFVMKKLKLGDYTPARLAIYWWERRLMGTINQDSGASLTDCIKVLTTNGCPTENMWPYNIKNYKIKPGPNTTTHGLNHRMKNGLSVGQNLTAMKSVIAEGFPFIFGFTVYQSFETGNWDRTTGIMPMPKTRDQILGGHAVTAVGYDDQKQAFKIRNSWGVNWGKGGYFWMPYTFIADPHYADDFWTAHEFATFKA